MSGTSRCPSGHRPTSAPSPHVAVARPSRAHHQAGRPPLFRAAQAGTSGMSYSRVPADDLRPLYNTLAQKYRLVIYSGDADQCVPYYGSEEWTYALGFNVTEPWRAWDAGTLVNASDRLVAGYVTKFGGAAKVRARRAPRAHGRGAHRRRGAAGLLVHHHQGRRPHGARVQARPGAGQPLFYSRGCGCAAERREQRALMPSARAPGSQPF